MATLVITEIVKNHDFFQLHVAVDPNIFDHGQKKNYGSFYNNIMNKIWEYEHF